MSPLVTGLAKGFGFSKIPLSTGDDAIAYWIATLGGSAGNDAKGITVDNSGNLYVVGSTSSTDSGLPNFLIAKYNSSGAIQWQRTLGGSDYYFVNGVDVDNLGNVYVVGQGPGGFGFSDLLIAKYNSSGTIQWQRALGGTGTDEGFGIAVDSSSNVYVIGRAGVNNNDFLIAKYNSSGTLQWQRTLGNTGTEEGYGIAVDSSSNVYVTGQTNSSGGGGYDFLISKYNSSGTLQWQRTLGGSSNDFGRGVGVDSSGNVYVAGYTASTGGGFDVLISKCDSSGTIQWQRSLRGSSSDIAWNIAVDSSGNAYVVGYTDSAGGGGYDFLIAKYNSSGTIQWQRTLGSSVAERGFGISVDSSDNLYVAGYTGSDALIAKLPADGSLTGTYGSFTYASSSFTDSAASLSFSIPSNTSSSSSLSSSASSLTDAAASLTSTLIPL